MSRRTHQRTHSRSPSPVAAGEVYLVEPLNVEVAHGGYTTVAVTNTTQAHMAFNVDYAQHFTFEPNHEILGPGQRMTVYIYLAPGSDDLWMVGRTVRVRFNMCVAHTPGRGANSIVSATLRDGGIVSKKDVKVYVR